MQYLRTFWSRKNLIFKKPIIRQLNNYQGYLWSKFKFNQTFITGVIVQNSPRLGSFGSRSKKNRCMRNTPWSSDLWIRKLRIDSLIIAFVRILCWPFGQLQGGNLGHLWSPKIVLVWLDLDVMPFDSPKDAVFREILVFVIIFDFPGWNWGKYFYGKTYLSRYPNTLKCRLYHL